MKAFVIGVTFAAGMWVQQWIGDPMLQRNFPCMEDEVLMFTVSHTERLSCVPLDILLPVTELASTLPPTTLGGN